VCCNRVASLAQMQLQLRRVQSTRCCELWYSERLVARVLATFGDAHLTGEFAGTLVFSQAHLAHAITALRAWWPVARDRAISNAHRLAEGVYHADCILAVLIATDAWAGRAFNVPNQFVVL
jgi:hypothetical protein